MKERVGVDYVACDRCGELILPGDLVGEISVPCHQECMIRSVAGSVNHQRRMMQGLSCDTIGELCADDPALTKREAAVAAYRYFIEHTSVRIARALPGQLWSED